MSQIPCRLWACGARVGQFLRWWLVCGSLVGCATFAEAPRQYQFPAVFSGEADVVLRSGLRTEAYRLLVVRRHDQISLELWAGGSRVALAQRQAFGTTSKVAAGGLRVSEPEVWLGVLRLFLAGEYEMVGGSKIFGSGAQGRVVFTATDFRNHGAASTAAQGKPPTESREDCLFPYNFKFHSYRPIAGRRVVGVAFQQVRCGAAAAI